MRTIQKSLEPKELTYLRESWGINANYDRLRDDDEVTNIVISQLLTDQGRLCAYTGLRITEDGCHIEHIKPQNYCEHGEDVTYNNLLACYPAPNQKKGTQFGAVKKDNWPSSAETYQFVSPLSKSCEERFIFNLRGEISTLPGDTAAATTVKKLRLDHPILNDYRKATIQAIIGRNNELSISEARKKLHRLESQKSGQLDPFCFVLVYALRKHIKRLEAIANSKRERK